MHPPQHFSLRTALAAAALPAVAALALPTSVQATLAIEDITFHQTDTIGYDGSSPVDNGGGLFIQVRNTGATVEELTSENVLINGTPVTTVMTEGPSSPTPGWVRVWPETIAPGEVTTWVIKSFGGTLTEGATLSSIEVSSDGGSTATATAVTLDTPPLRIAHIVPSEDFREIWVFLRNEDASAIAVDELVLNDDVTASTTFVGGPTVDPGSLVIAKVAYPDPVPLLLPLAVRASGLRTSDSSRVTVGSFVRLTEPEYGLTTWGSSPSNNEARVQRVRELYGLTGNSWGGVSPILASKANRYFYRQRMLDILDMTDTDTVDMTNAGTVTALAGTGQVGAWFVEDEPDLSYGGATRNPRAMANLSRAYWRLDPGTPTHLNLVSSRSAQAYALAVDNPALDAYMQYAPRHYGSVVSVTYDIDEALDQTENLKRVSEPIRVWMTPQGVSPGTWGTQPTPWGIAIQFWAQVMGGAKGLDGFKFDDTLTDSSDPGGNRTQRIIELIQELRLVEYLLLYGDPLNTVVTNKPSADLAARMIVSDQAVVVPVVNLDARHSRTVGIWGTPSKTDQTNVNLSIPVPGWVNIEQVVEVTPSGFVPVAHTVAGNTVEITGLTVVDSRVFLIGAEDTTPPAAPTGLQAVPDLNNPGGTLLSWKQPTDNVGTMGYKVYENGVEVADVRTPIAAITAPAPGDCPSVYEVRAYDGAGNLGPSTGPLVLDGETVGANDFRFSSDGDFEGWQALNDIASATVEDGSLVLELADVGPPPGFLDSVIANGGLSIDASVYDLLFVRLKNETPNTSFEIFWQNNIGGWAGPGTGTDSRYFAASISGNDASFRDYLFVLADNDAWEGTVDNVRLDPANGNTPGTVRIDRIAFLSSANLSPAWLFKSDGDAEGWDEPPFNQISSFDVQGGQLLLQVSGNDPWIYSTPFRASASNNRYLIIRIQNETAATQSEVYWSSTASPGIDGTKRLDFSLTPNATGVEEVVLDMQGRPGWAGDIDLLRIDPTANGPAGLVRIESIRLANDLAANSAPILTAPPATLEVDAGDSVALPEPFACDLDSEGTDIQIRLESDNGTVAFNAIAGAARVVDGANGTGGITVRGSSSAINQTLLGGAIYTSDPLFDGIDSVRFILDDLGNGRPGGPQTDTATYTVQVNGTGASVPAWETFE